MRKLLLLVLLAAIVSSAAGEVYYEAEANRTSVAVNSTVQLDCDRDCPVNSWTVTLRKPSAAEVREVVSTAGKVEDFQVYDERVVVNTFHEDGVDSETVRMNYIVRRDAQEVVEGLYRREFSLPGFSGESNSGVLEVQELVSGKVYSDADYSFSGDRLSFRGSGALNARVLMGEGESTRYYEFFPWKRDAGNAFTVTAGTLGSFPRSERIPVAIMDRARYNRTVNRWSAGQFQNSAIVMREDLGEEFQPVLAHETVHAVNSHRLDWETDSAWMDEGLAKYVEYLVKKQERGESRVRELFGEEKSYVEYRDGKRYRYTLPSSGNRDDLWRYYENDRDFMKYWSSESGERSFGYAYSELIVRNHVRNGGDVRQLYDNLSGMEFDSDDEKWSRLSSHLELQPCDYSSRDRFDRCLDRINDYEYPVYSAEPDMSSDNLSVTRLEVPNRSSGGSEEGSAGNGERPPGSLLDWLIERLGSFIETLV